MDSANLDFLRACAVLAVYFAHMLQTFGIERIAGPITIYDLGQVGVLIFFVHTSMVLMFSLERMQVRGARLFAVFYTRRVFRIYPLSIFTVLAMAAAHVPSFPTASYSWPGWPALAANLSLTQNLSDHASYPAVLWSLPYEMEMYVVLPAIWLLLGRFRSVWIPILLWAADVATIVILLRAGAKQIPDILWFAPCFLGGIAGYRLWIQWPRRWHFLGWPALIVACVGLRAAAGTSGIAPAPTLASQTACLLLGAAAPLFRELREGLARRAAAETAKYSYGIYLSHSTVFWLAFVHWKWMPAPVQFTVCAILSVLFPLAMYHGIEKPMIAAGVRLANRFAGGREAVAAA